MKDWFKKHYVGLGAGVIAGIALFVGAKSCSNNNAVNDRIDGIEANVDTLTMNQQELIEVVKDNTSILGFNTQELLKLKDRMSAVEDSIEVHREDIDSLRHDVDSIFKRQEKCPCINPVAQKPAPQKPVVQKPAPQKPVVQKPAPQKPVVQNPAPVHRDTVVVVVKPEPAPVAAPVQDARGCGDDQNANVVIHGDNNTVNISNNGNSGAVAHSDTTRTVTRRVSAKCSSTLVVNTVVTRNSYCR